MAKPLVMAKTPGLAGAAIGSLGIRKVFVKLAIRGSGIDLLQLYI